MPNSKTTDKDMPKWIQELDRQLDEIAEDQKKRERGELPPLWRPNVPPEDRTDLDKLIAETKARNGDKDFLTVLAETDCDFFDDMSDDEFFQMIEEMS